MIIWGVPVLPPKTALCLGDLACYVKDSCDCLESVLETYVSTESMLPNKSGIELADSVPQSGSVNRYMAGDILVSNIRPYFKKIWKANRYGTCSNDILVIRPYDVNLTDYLYALLSDDRFFDYVMLGSKGTKMPRGDKNQIILYPIQEKTKTEMLAIGKIIAAIDSKITLNQSINDNLAGNLREMKHRFHRTLVWA